MGSRFGIAYLGGKMGLFKDSEVIDDNITRWISVLYLTGSILMVLMLGVLYIDEAPKIELEYLLLISIATAIVVSKIRVIRIGILELTFFLQDLGALLVLILIPILVVLFIAVYYEIDFLLDAFVAVLKFFQNIWDKYFLA